MIFLYLWLPPYSHSHYKPMSRCRNEVPLEQDCLWTASEMFECYILHPPGPPHRLKVEKERWYPPTVNALNKTWSKALHSKIQKQYILSDYKLFLSECHKSQIPLAASCFYCIQVKNKLQFPSSLSARLIITQFCDTHTPVFNGIQNVG